MSRKHVWIAIWCNTIWGLASLYWYRLAHIDALLVLYSRIIFAAVLAYGMVLATRKRGELKAKITDRKTMKYMIPAALIISFNWGMYIWAMGHGHMIDASLGYFMAPLMVFAVSVGFFGEKAGKLQLAAMFIALTGVLVSIAMYRTVPVIGLVLGFSFTVYGTIKKKVKVYPAVSIFIESIVLTPFALVLMALTMRPEIKALAPVDFPLLMGTGVLTAVPLVLYASAVNNIPYITLGFTQYISPAITVLVGLFYGEMFTPEKKVLLGFILASLALYSYAGIRDVRRLKEEVRDVPSTADRS